MRVLDGLADLRDPPASYRVDNGPEFISKALDCWAYHNNVKLDFIRPGKPTNNPHVKSFNWKFRRECLSQDYFLGLAESRQGVDNWRVEYNRPSGLMARSAN